MEDSLIRETIVGPNLEEKKKSNYILQPKGKKRSKNSGQPRVHFFLMFSWSLKINKECLISAVQASEQFSFEMPDGDFESRSSPRIYSHHK